MQSISHFACHPQTLFTILRAKQHSQSFYFNFSPSNNTPLNPFIFINHTTTQQQIIQVSEEEEEEEEEEMETLVKQMRVRFSGIGLDDQEGINSNRERRIPPQKTQSFKGERKGGQNWFRRQFSWQMNQDNDANDGGEFATAIAAAAFAITSLEEEGLRSQKKMNGGLETTLSSKSRKESRFGLPDPGRVSRRFTVKDTREDKQIPGEASEKPEMKMPKVVAIEERKPEKIAITAPSIKKTTTFADQTLNVTGKTKSGKKLDTRISDTKLAEGQTLSTMGEGKRTEQLPVSGIAETQARAWEQAEMERIEKRYERMNSTIASWENEKKVKARRRLDRIESELEKRRARTLQHYRSDMSRIDKVAGGAKALAQERKRNEESKTKEKAKKIRSTGKVPVTCFCI